MEFQLAPEGRADWLVYARAFWLHAGPVVMHWIDIVLNQKSLRKVYVGVGKGMYFWASVGGYFAMGLTWEFVNGDSSGTYKIEKFSPEVYANVSKALAVLSCIVSFVCGTKAFLIDKKN